MDRDLGTSSDLLSHYDDYYGDPQLAEWRKLGAEGKTQNILDLCEPYPHSKIIDIGCGDGVILERLSSIPFGDELYGLEISNSAIEQLSNRKIPNLVDVSLFDGYSISYPEKFFDLAILSHVVEHVEYPRQLIYEAARVAAYIFVEVPLEHTLRLRHNYVENLTGHINFYDHTTIRRLLQTCGLTVLDQRVTDTSKGMVQQHHPKVGALLHYARSVGQCVAPGIAQRLFVYHSALICKSLSE